MMMYTVIVSDRTRYEAGIERRIVCEGDLNHACGVAQVTVATEVLEASHGTGAQPHDHEDEWLWIYDRIPVLAIIEGEPKVWLNDEAVEPHEDNYTTG